MSRDLKIYELKSWSNRKKEKENEKKKETKDNEPVKQSVSGISLPKRLPDKIRKLRGLLIAKRGDVKRNHKGWTVKGDHNKDYQVKFDKLKGYSCNCPDSEHRITWCKHVHAVDASEDDSELPSKDELVGKLKELEKQHEKSSKFTQNWTAYNKAQCSEKEMLYRILHNICALLKEPEQKNGRPKVKTRDIIFCLVAKVYNKDSGRRFSSEMKSFHENGYITSDVHHNTISKYMRGSETEDLLQQLIDIIALEFTNKETVFAFDATGFSTEVKNTWNEYKHKVKKQEKKWVKGHIITGIESNIVTAVKVTDNHVSDNSQFGYLFQRTSENFKIQYVLTDGAYTSKENFEMVHSQGGEMYSPFRSNATGKKRGSKLWAQKYREYVDNKEEVAQYLGMRNNAETVFHMVNSKFDNKLKSREHQAMVNEVLCKFVCHNICVLISELCESNLETQTMYQNEIMENPEGGVCISG